MFYELILGRHQMRIRPLFSLCPIFLYIREFGIRADRYVNYRIVLVGEITISLSVPSCSEGMVSYPECAN